MKYSISGEVKVVLPRWENLGGTAPYKTAYHCQITVAFAVDYFSHPPHLSLPSIIPMRINGLPSHFHHSTRHKDLFNL